ncbi:hypothetical protein D3C75_1198570 [compost metagenome]
MIEQKYQVVVRPSSLSDLLRPGVADLATTSILLVLTQLAAVVVNLGAEGLDKPADDLVGVSGQIYPPRQVEVHPECHDPRILSQSPLDHAQETG